MRQASPAAPVAEPAPDSLEAFARAEVARDREAGRGRAPVPTSRQGGSAAPAVWRAGRRLISFSCNDYLNLATHPAVIDAAVAAVRQYGAGAGASRLVSGDHPLLGALEARLASWKATGSACVFGSGYLANIGIVPALAGPGDAVLLDELAHSCLFAGARLSGARLRRFRHNDLADLEHALRAARPRSRHVLIATDRVFSMDGDLAPLAEISALAAAHDAWLLIDDAHGTGVLPQDPAPSGLRMGTLSKALGSYGGYVCASDAVVRLLHHRAASLIYATGLPPASAAAALAALDVIGAEPDRARRPLEHARLFAQLAGLPAPQGPIVPVLLGTEAAALRAAARLEEAGFLAVAIRPPTVPEGTSRLRLAFTAAHAEDDVRLLAELVRGL
jgi:8-amino-7-oxononanoate synthase